MHDITFLWSHPRSVSSAMERIMLERGDFKTFHEPFIYLYYVHDAKKALKHFEMETGHPRSYAAIKKMLIDASRDASVFVKDMSYYVIDYILEDTEFLSGVRNTFLIRDPRRSIPSFFRIDPQVTLEEIGLDAEYRHFNRLREITGATPVVVDAEDLLAHPESTLRAYCRALGIPFIPEALSWDRGLPEKWRFVAGWHEDIHRSTGITSRRPAAADFDDQPKLGQYYEHHAPFYRMMRRHKLSIDQDQS